MRAQEEAWVVACASPTALGRQSASLGGFARRAAAADGVYSPDVRRPAEVGADRAQPWVAWLSRRLGTEAKPPNLKP